MTAAALRAARRTGLRLLIEVPAVLVTFVMMLHVTANALLRTFADSPINNTLEIVQYWYLPIIAFLGFIAAQQRGQHIAADLIYEKAPLVTRPFILSVVFGVCAAVSSGFAWFGLQEALHAYEIKKTAGVSDLISWPTYFLAPIAFGSLTLQLTVAAVRAITRPETDHLALDSQDAVVLEPATSVESTSTGEKR